MGQGNTWKEGEKLKENGLPPLRKEVRYLLFPQESIRFSFTNTDYWELEKNNSNRLMLCITLDIVSVSSHLKGEFVTEQKLLHSKPRGEGKREIFPK